ncbi:Rrf2 family transcriptional regulator [Thalassococcus halodurans]|uniref:Rrf2 family transcriptional regulator n=1 Tax=Thalassococcus halodurans TaxID=373675 RepID=UPI002E0E293C
MFCAIKRGERITKSSIAQVCNVSEHHLGQIVNQLAQLGYLRTQRGRKGGARSCPSGRGYHGGCRVPVFRIQSADCRMS